MTFVPADEIEPTGAVTRYAGFRSLRYAASLITK